MADISVLLPDGSSRSLPQGSSVADLAASIGSRLAKAAVAGTINGSEVDLSTALADGVTVSIITDNSDEGRHVLRHSTAHVLAQAVVQLFPVHSSPLGLQLKMASITTLNFLVVALSLMTILQPSKLACARS